MRVLLLLALSLSCVWAAPLLHSPLDQMFRRSINSAFFDYPDAKLKEDAEDYGESKDNIAAALRFAFDSSDADRLEKMFVQTNMLKLTKPRFGK